MQHGTRIVPKIPTISKPPPGMYSPGVNQDSYNVKMEDFAIWDKAPPALARNVYPETANVEERNSKEAEEENDIWDGNKQGSSTPSPELPERAGKMSLTHFVA